MSVLSTAFQESYSKETTGEKGIAPLPVQLNSNFK